MPRESSIFNTLDEFIRSEGFDYFFYNDILKISDIGLSKNEITLILELQLEGMKDIQVPQTCPFDAIEITENKIAKIIIEKCTRCKKCVASCPKNVIDMVPYDKYVVVACNNKEPAKVVRPKCSVSCIGCKICVKACPVDAIGFDNNLAIIDYEKCINCFICAKKCPTKAIEGELDRMKEAKSRKKLSS